MLGQVVTHSHCSHRCRQDAPDHAHPQKDPAGEGNHSVGRGDQDAQGQLREEAQQGEMLQSYCHMFEIRGILWDHRIPAR